MIQTVIFDMGQTLLNFARPGSGSWREFETPGIRGVYRYLVEQGHPIASHEDGFIEAMFDRLATGWQQATGGHINLRAIDWIAAGVADHALTLDEIALREAVHRYAQPLRHELSTMPGAIETLTALRKQGYRIGLISNTIWPGDLHIEDLAALQVLPYLDATLFSGDLGIWKPQSGIFTCMLETLQSTPSQAVFVGDSPREDILGAQGVGMRAVWLRNREFPLGEIQPDAIIETLPGLLSILERWHA